MKIYISLIIILIFFAKELTAAETQNNVMTIGAIMNDESRVGKEAKVGIEMAISEFNSNNSQSFVLRLEARNSKGKPWLAALAGGDLVDNHQVNVILGPHTLAEVSSVAEIASETGTAVISLTDSVQGQGTEQWPFLIHLSSTLNSQIQALTEIIQSRGLNKITLIYENTDSSSSEISHHLADALNQIGQNIDHAIALSPFASPSQILERLKRNDCRVFVLHSSLLTGVNLLESAKKLGMLEKGFLWIVTNMMMDHLDSANYSQISSMQGVLGIKTSLQGSREKIFMDFKRKFILRFIEEYPEEENYDPGVFGVLAYDATTAVMLALKNCKPNFTAHQLFDKMSEVHFSGLSGDIRFVDRKLAMVPVAFEVISVIGNRNKAIWSSKDGLKESIDDETPVYSPSLGDYGHSISARRQLLTNAEPLRVLVPSGALFKQFVDVKTDARNVTTYGGFVIEVFRATMNELNISYEFFPFNRTGFYDDLVREGTSGNYDAVAGDVTILAARSKYADFTQPFTESGLEMIVVARSRMPNKVLLFLEPFTWKMWLSILGITIYNGIVMYLIEREGNGNLREGSVLHQIGTLFWLAFIPLLSLNGGKLKNNWVRMSMMVWLFVALILAQSYTASLASMLTTQSLEPSITDIETLKANNMTVGYCRGSSVSSYLVNVLGFENKYVKNYPETSMYAGALRSGELAALFLEVPSAKLFLAQNCRSFITAGETYKNGGYGFAFRKNYTLLSTVNEALLNVSERGKLKKLEDEFITSEKCVDVGSPYKDTVRLDIGSFWVLFGSTVGISTIALVVYLVTKWCKPQDDLNSQSSRRVRHADIPDDQLPKSPSQPSSRVNDDDIQFYTPQTSKHWEAV